MLYWFADGVRTEERKKGLSFGCPPVFEAIYLQYSQSSSSLSFSVDIDCAATYQFFANQQSRWQKARPTPMWFIFNTAIERHLTWGKVFRQLHPTRWCICFLYSFQGNFIDSSLLLPLLRPRANKCRVMFIHFIDSHFYAKERSSILVMRLKHWLPMGLVR